MRNFEAALPEGWQRSYQCPSAIPQPNSPADTYRKELFGRGTIRIHALVIIWRQMVRFRQIASLVLLLALVGPSAMACLIPNAQLTPAEHQCCKAMLRQCASMPGTVSHSCCRGAASRDNLVLAAQRTGTLIAYAPPAASVDFSALTLPASAQFPGSAFTLRHPPPGSLRLTTVLRI